MVFTASRSIKTDFHKVIFFKKLNKYTANKALIDNTFDDLLNDYFAEQRHYHDFAHINHLLTLLDENKYQIQDEEVVYFSIWFHDVIYNPWKTNNEEKSADFADEVLRQTSMSPQRIEKVVAYINATKTHTSNGDSDLAWFLDFDLSILGAEDGIYDVYTRQIREEYSAFPNFIYNRGRKKALRGLLEKDFLYHTADFREKYEAKARQNIQRELDSL
jgi:predicted metal-dependent HD superfamily phosphohydrolase